MKSRDTEVDHHFTPKKNNNVLLKLSRAQKTNLFIQNNHTTKAKPSLSHLSSLVLLTKQQHFAAARARQEKLSEEVPAALDLSGTNGTVRTAPSADPQELKPPLLPPLAQLHTKPKRIQNQKSLVVKDNISTMGSRFMQ